MTWTTIKYRSGAMMLDGVVLLTWPGGSLKSTVPKTDVRVMSAGDSADGFITGPAKCTFSVEGAVPAAGIDDDRVRRAMGGAVLTFSFTIGDKQLSGPGLLGAVYFSNSPAGPRCDFEAHCMAPSWE